MEQMFRLLGPYFEDGAKIMLRLFLILATVIFLIHTLIALLDPYPLDYGEAPLVDQAMRLASGQNIYRQDLSSPPYTISNYPPLYVLTLTPFVKLFGPNFWVGRVISVLSALASAVFLALIIHTHTQNRMAAQAAGLLFLTIPYVVQWSPLLRVDMLALAFSTGALYVVSRWPHTSKGWTVGALLLVAAVFTRQSYGLAAPLAACLWLWTQDRKQALKLAGLAGGVGIVLLFGLNVVTRGGFFFNIFTANVNAFDFKVVEDYWGGLRDMAPMLLILASAFLFFGYPRASGKTGAGGFVGMKCWPLLAPYLIGATLSAVTVGKIGSNVNYLLELSAALSLVAGALLAWGDPAPSGIRTNLSPVTGPKSQAGPVWQPLLRSGLLILLAVQAGYLVRSTLMGPVQIVKERLRPAEVLKELKWTVGHAGGPVLADEFMGMLTLNNEPLYIQPFEVTQLANAGRWDQTALLASIRKQEFPLILIHNFMLWSVYKTRWTPEMLSEIMASYVATDFVADTIVFRPRDAAEHGMPNLGACPGAPWRLPTRGEFGMWWVTKELGFMGEGYENTVPVYAVADGLLMRRADWNDAVAIQHDDPLQPGAKVWTFYSGMADQSNHRSYIVPAFPEGAEGKPVKRGQLLGYQGRWWNGPVWMHAAFAVMPALADGAFPAELVGRATDQDPPLPHDLKEQGLLDPSPYIGTIRSQIMGSPVWLPLRCQEITPGSQE